MAEYDGISASGRVVCQMVAIGLGARGHAGDQFLGLLDPGFACRAATQFQALIQFSHVVFAHGCNLLQCGNACFMQHGGDLGPDAINQRDVGDGMRIRAMGSVVMMIMVCMIMACVIVVLVFVRHDFMVGVLVSAMLLNGLMFNMVVQGLNGTEPMDFSAAIRTTFGLPIGMGQAANSVFMGLCVVVHDDLLWVGRHEIRNSMIAD